MTYEISGSFKGSFGRLRFSEDQWDVRFTTAQGDLWVISADGLTITFDFDTKRLRVADKTIDVASIHGQGVTDLPASEGMMLHGRTESRGIPEDDLKSTGQRARVRPTGYSGSTNTGGDGIWLQGSNGRVRISGSNIELARSLKDDILFGNLRGTHTIPIRTVQAVHFKPATRRVEGVIEFVVAGTQAVAGGGVALDKSGVATALVGRQMARAGHANSITFPQSKQTLFASFHDLVLKRMDSLNEPTPAAAPTRKDLATQLRDLKALLDEGILTTEEFDEAKQALIRRVGDA